MITKQPKRTSVIHVRVTDAERDVIITRATKVGRSVSSYARRLLLAGEARLEVGEVRGQRVATIKPGSGVKLPTNFLGSASGTESA